MKRRAEQVALVSGMTLASLNLWTGVPLSALWLGSRAAGDQPISMLAVLVVVVTMLALGFAVVRALGAMDRRLRALSGRELTVRRHAPWLRSMRGERTHDPDSTAAQLNALDYVLVAVVVAAVLTFEYWFFFVSGSPIDQRTGR